MTPRAPVIWAASSLTIRLVPASGAVDVSISMSPKRFARGLKRPPLKSCQTLVKKVGTVARLAAVNGDCRAPRSPMTTVGRPMPYTPLA
jgi:hypothetical protein